MGLRRAANQLILTDHKKLWAAALTLVGLDSAGCAMQGPMPTEGAVSMGGDVVCVLNEGSGSCQRLGAMNDFGQAEVPAGEYAAISPGFHHTCGLTTAGQAVCWGSNSYGQTEAPNETFVQVSAGGHHSCGLREDGSVTCWGMSVPYHAGWEASPIEDPPEAYTKIDEFENGGCGIRLDTTLACWDVGMRFGRAHPEPKYGFVELSGEGESVCGLSDDGSVDCLEDWAHWWTPSEDGAQFSQVALSHSTACGITAEGDLRCWGDASYVVQQNEAGPWDGIAAGYWATCAIGDQGLKCWGTGGADTEFEWTDVTPSRWP